MGLFTSTPRVSASCKGDRSHSSIARKRRDSASEGVSSLPGSSERSTTPSCIRASTQAWR
jgi:hypothetical protein